HAALREGRPDHHGDAALTGAHGWGRFSAAYPLSGHHGNGLGEAHEVHKQGDGHSLNVEVHWSAARIHQTLQPARRALASDATHSRHLHLSQSSHLPAPLTHHRGRARMPARLPTAANHRPCCHTMAIDGSYPRALTLSLPLCLSLSLSVPLVLSLFLSALLSPHFTF